MYSLAEDKPSMEDKLSLDIQAVSREQSAKFCSSVVSLSYGDRTVYARGSDDLVRELPHKMEDEWLRESTVWSDWKGVSYTGEEIWGYVTGPATSQVCTPGLRDAENVGMLPTDFQERAHTHIRQRKPDASSAELLTLDEVLSVRIYTGPGYQPLNGWLRKTAQLTTTEERRAAALDMQTTFGATAGHVISAIRKIAAANLPEENVRPLFRGLKGQLPASFWLPDAKGIVCACDVAFKSTSLGRATPIHYMAQPPSQNLLWEIQAGVEDDVGYHCGAEVAFLSQFAGEREVLFPPYVMLTVQKRQGMSPPPPQPRGASLLDQVAYSREVLQVMQESVDGKEFESVTVLPTFSG